MPSSPDHEVSQAAARTLQTPILQCPSEILCPIVVSLDPISLINLSQTSRGFRHFIQPTKAHFLQHVLALELLPENNGRNCVLPLFDDRSNSNTNDQDWEGVRYACAGCLRLRSYMFFDPQAISKLGFKKPPPWSTEANRATDWEPFNDAGDPENPRRMRKRIEKREKERALWRRLYLDATLSWRTPLYRATSRSQQAQDTAEAGKSFERSFGSITLFAVQSR